MKALIPLLIVSTSALAVTTVQFAQRAGAERKRADDALVMSQKHETRIRELEKAQGTLEQQLMEAQRPAPLVEPAPAVARRSATTVRPQETSRPGLVDYSVRSASGNSAPVLQPYVSMRESPAAQRYMRAQMKASMRRQYEDVGQALGLSQEQANKLIDVLSEPQTRMIGLPKGPMDRASIMQAAQDAKKRSEDAVAALIGQDKLPQWQEYQKTMPERMQATQVRDELQRMGTPLSDDQRTQLVDILIEQRQQNPRPVYDYSAPSEETRQAWTKWQDDADKALLERAKSVLTKEQYEHYRDYQEWQTEMRNNSFRNFRPAMPVLQSGQAVSQDNSVAILSSSAVFVPPPPETPAPNK